MRKGIYSLIVALTFWKRWKSKKPKNKLKETMRMDKGGKKQDKNLSMSVKQYFHIFPMTTHTTHTRHFP